MDQAKPVWLIYAGDGGIFFVLTLDSPLFP